MRCGHCKARDTSIDHVRLCAQTEQAIRSIGSPDRITSDTGFRPLSPEAHRAAVAAAAPVTEPGVYFDGEHYYKVVWNQTQTNLYAKVWDAEWVYAPGAMKRLTAGQKVTAEQAAKFGRLWGSCVFCSRMLTDERSVAVGYGPVCAEHNGLPWGEVARA